MTNRQVITITPDGSMSGLQRKPGQGIDLRQFGRADIKRASLVEWDEAAQAWFIDVLQDHGKGVLTRDKFNAAVGESAYAVLQEITDLYFADTDGTLLFDDYDDAVKVEIAYLDALRLKGEF